MSEAGASTISPLSKSGDDTVITYDGGSIMLEGIQASQITEADFDFIG